MLASQLDSARSTKCPEILKTEEWLLAAGGSPTPVAFTALSAAAAAAGDVARAEKSRTRHGCARVKETDVKT